MALLTRIAVGGAGRSYLPIAAKGETEVAEDTKADGAAGSHGRRSVVVEDRYVPEIQEAAEEKQERPKLRLATSKGKIAKTYESKPLEDTFKRDEALRQAQVDQKAEDERIVLANEIAALDILIAQDRENRELEAVRQELILRQQEEELMITLLLMACD